jgi:hypothetical protein
MLSAQNIQKINIYVYVAAAAAGILSNYLPERRRRGWDIWSSAAAAGFFSKKSAVAAAKPHGLHL